MMSEEEVIPPPNSLSSHSLKTILTVTSPPGHIHPLSTEDSHLHQHSDNRTTSPHQDHTDCHQDLKEESVPPTEFDMDDVPADIKVSSVQRQQHSFFCVGFGLYSLSS